MWKKRFSSVKTPRKKPKPEEFQLKFMHRIIVTKRELFRDGIQSNDDWLYCGSVVAKRTPLTILLATVCLRKKNSKEVSWSNVTNIPQFNSSMEEKLFCVTSEPFGKKINCTLLFIIFVIEFE